MILKIAEINSYVLVEECKGRNCQTGDNDKTVYTKVYQHSSICRLARQ